MTLEEQIDREIQEQVERLHTAFLRDLAYVGEMCVNHARKLPSMSRANPAAVHPHQPNYIDDTGNLRSSIGYVLVDNGRVVDEKGFQQVLNGKKGSDTGRKFAHEVAASYNDGIALILVAGMDYAVYVSALGYDVLDSAELLAIKLVRDLTNTYNQP